MSLSEKLFLRNKILGVIIRDARHKAGKTQDDCGTFLGMSASTFSDIEYGERPISLPELEAFAFLVDVPLEHFFGDALLAENNGTKHPPSDELVELRNRVIGVLMRQARTAAGRTQAECAALLDVPDSRISAYEYGQTPIPLSELEALAGLLEIPLETFVDEEHNPIGQQLRRRHTLEELEHLPQEVQAFVLEPLNVSYLRTALKLSKMPAEDLRTIAESLLEITY
jgi:transcriptional regulator with XRE-family HTH domain